MLLLVAVNPRNIPFVFFWSSFGNSLAPGIRAHTLDPKTLNLLKLGLFPVSISYGVDGIDLFGSLFLVYTAVLRAYDQYSGPKSA